jgi:predicted RNA-binding protein YlxR (DUF448 family)
MKGGTLRFGGGAPLRGRWPAALGGGAALRKTMKSAVSSFFLLSAATPPKAAQPPSPPKAAKRSSPPRRKHVPRRMCVVCRRHDAKRGLYRIVRTPEGSVEPDPTGRRNGRGAYLCDQAACWEKALGSGILSRALNVEIDTDTLNALRRHAATLPLASPTATGAAQEEGGDA